MNIETALQHFLIDQELKGNSEKTKLFYKINVNYFMDFVGRDKQVSELVKEDLSRYYLNLKSRPKDINHPFKPKTDKGLTKVTMQTYLRAIKAFVSWCYSEEYLQDDISKKFKLPKATRKTIEILSDEEISSIMNVYNQRTEMGIRNLLIVGFMLDCGLRLNEVSQLEIENVHITQGVVKVLGKGDKERIVPFGLFMKKLLFRYVNTFRSLPQVDTKRLIIDRNYMPISENGIKMVFHRLKKCTGIDRLYPHLLRHTFATTYLINGGDLFSLQQILGHTSLEMVRKYSHIASSYLINKHKLYSPLDVLRSNKGNGVLTRL